MCGCDCVEVCGCDCVGVWECDCVGESGSMWVWQPCLIVSLCVCVCGWARGWGVCNCVGVCGCDCVCESGSVWV